LVDADAALFWTRGRICARRCSATSRDLAAKLERAIALPN
jgi:hypothetical protein